ncbi:HEAT repeat domain-containing protein [Actinoplanes sp. NPDC020271]|uniref:HEAT repeat domain-containing protein n=1 Tax=Actinoplanes sp. NPDC020271 TaxID=3363896 RepID=UPI0037BC438E
MTFADIREAADGNLDLDYYDLVRELVASGDRSAVEPAREALEEYVAARNGHGRDLMALVVAGLDGAASFPLLLDVHADAIRREGLGDLDTMNQALHQAATADPASARAVILPRLTDSDPIVRRAALQAIGFVPERSDLPLLRAALTDPDRWVRHTAIGSLPAVTDDPEVYQILVAALHDPDGWVQREAVIILGWGGPPTVVDHLVTRLDEPGLARQARSAMGGAIGRAAKGSDRTATAAAALRELIADPDPATRANAVRGIRELGEPLDALNAVADDTDWLVRETLRGAGNG